MSGGDTPCFSDVWQGKDLQEGDFVCVAAKGVRRAFLGCVAGKEFSVELLLRYADTELAGTAVTPHPPGFCIDVNVKGLREKGFVRP